MTMIILAVLLGSFFGFALQRTGASDPDKIIGMLRLTDLHLLKTILIAIGVSSLLLFVGLALGWMDAGHLSVKPVYLGVVIGGLILGAGWSISAFCPGTGVAALGAGRKDALAFIVGGLCGGGLFMVSYASLKNTALFTAWDIGKVTVAQTGRYQALLENWGTVAAVFLAVLLILLAYFLPQTRSR